VFAGKGGEHEGGLLKGYYKIGSRLLTPTSAGDKTGGQRTSASERERKPVGGPDKSKVPLNSHKAGTWGRPMYQTPLPLLLQVRWVKQGKKSREVREKVVVINYAKGGQTGKNVESVEEKFFTCVCQRS